MLRSGQTKPKFAIYNATQTLLKSGKFIDEQKYDDSNCLSDTTQGSLQP